MLTPSAAPSASPTKGPFLPSASARGLRQRLTQLPRDARDTLFLLALIAWVVMLQAQHLPWWCTALTGAVLLWRGVLSWQGLPLPSRWWLVSILVLTVAATLLTHRTIFGREAGVTLIVVLLALKTLELRARRDAFVVFFLALFTLLTHFSFSQSLLTALGVLLALWGLLTGLVNAHMTAGRPALWLAARTAGWLTLLGAPIMAVLFVLFPRVAPLWGLPADAHSARTGLSERMRVGQVAQLAQDFSVAMRVKFDGPAPAPQDLYFRGPVLTRFDGAEWRPLRSSLPASMQLAANLQPLSPAIRYEVTLQPHQHPWLLLLDAAVQAPSLGTRTLSMTPDLLWWNDRPITAVVRYQAQSHVRFRHGPLLPELGLQDALELPAGFNPRTMALAQQWRQDTQHQPNAEEALVQRALTLLRTGGYTYSLSPGVYGTHSADEFWFDRKLGFCEHIASAFVLLMRSLDIPARIVTGYQGGEANPIDGLWTVRQSDAHAWAEVWLAGQGWVRVDPTAAVAPSRATGEGRLEPVQGLVGTAMQGLHPALGRQLRAAWDAVNNRWNQWVLNYTQDRQFDLLRRLGFESPSWQHLGYLLSAVVVVAAALGGLWTLWERRQHDPWLRLLQRARQRATRAGLHTPPHATPRQLAHALEQRYPHAPATQALVNWLLALEALRYAQPSHAKGVTDRPNPAPDQQAPQQNPHQRPQPPELPQLAREFARLRWPSQTDHGLSKQPPAPPNNAPAMPH